MIVAQPEWRTLVIVLAVYLTRTVLESEAVRAVVLAFVNLSALHGQFLTLPYAPDMSGLDQPLPCSMDKKQINDPKMTANFLIWVGGVFMLLLFAFLAHFVWRVL